MEPFAVFDCLDRLTHGLVAKYVCDVVLKSKGETEYRLTRVRNHGLFDPFGNLDGDSNFFQLLVAHDLAFCLKDLILEGLLLVGYDIMDIFKLLLGRI